MNQPTSDEWQDRLVEDLRGLYPEMSEKKIVDVAERLRRYVQVIMDMAARIGEDPERLRELDLAILEIKVREWSTEDGQIGILRLKRGHRRLIGGNAENLEP